MTKLHFPHFPLFNPARVISSLEIALLWLGLAALIAINILTLQKDRPAHWNKLMMLFEEPLSVPRHIDLASLLWNQGQKEEARRLMISAQTLTEVFQVSQSDQSSKVLGATTNPKAILAQWEHEAQELKEKFAFWQSVASARPDYRDAFISLAALAYQLGKPNEARTWLTKAQALDPNSPTVQELSNFFK